MKRIIIYNLFVLILFAMIANLPAQEKLRKDGRFYVSEVEKSFKVGKGGNLIMKDIRGDVIISTWNKDEVKIFEIRKMDVYTEEEAKAVLKDLPSFYKKDGNNVTVGMEGSYRSYMSSNFKISVPVEFNVDVQTKGGDISVTNLKGGVELVTSGGDIDLIDIDGNVNAKTSGGDVVVERNLKNVNIISSGGDIKVIKAKGIVTAKTSGGDIKVADNDAKVIATTSGGSIELSNIRAEVVANTSGGDIQVSGTKGALEVKTSGGDIELSDIGDVIKAKTSGGDIEAKNVINGIEAYTSGGDIQLSDIRGFIEAKTSGGDIETEMTLTDFSKDHHVELRSSGGDIEIILPAKLPATINASIKITESSWRDYNIKSEFDLEIERTNGKDRKRGQEEFITAKGKINGGGDLINLETTNGNIVIKKSR